MVIKSFPVHTRREDLSSYNRFLIELVSAIKEKFPHPMPPTLALVSSIRASFADGCSLLTCSNDKDASWEGLDDSVAAWLREESNAAQKEGRRQEVFHGFDRDKKVDYLAISMAQGATLLVWRSEKLFYPDDCAALQVAVLLFQGHSLAAPQDRAYLNFLEGEWAPRANTMSTEITHCTLNNSREMIILFGAEGGQVSWYNRTATEMFSQLNPFPLHCDHDHFRWLSRIVHPEDLKKTMSTLREALNTGLNKIFSARFAIDDRHHHLLRCELTPSEHDLKRPREWILSGINLTKLEIYSNQQKEDMSIVVDSMQCSVRNLKGHLEKGSFHQGGFSYELEILEQNLYSLAKYFEVVPIGPAVDSWDIPSSMVDLEKAIDACIERHAQRLKTKSCEVIVEWLNNKHVMVELKEKILETLLDVLLQCFLRDPNTVKGMMTIKYRREEDKIIIRGPAEQAPLDFLTVATIERLAQVLGVEHAINPEAKEVKLCLKSKKPEYRDPISGGGSARCQLLQSLETFLRFLPTGSPIRLTCCSAKGLIRKHLRQMLQDQPRLKMQIVEDPTQVQWDYSVYNIIVFDFIHQPESFAKQILEQIMEKISRDRTYFIALGCPKDSLEDSRVAYSCVSQPLLDREVVSAILDTIIRFALTTSVCPLPAQASSECSDGLAKQQSTSANHRGSCSLAPKLAGEYPLQIMVVEDSILNQKMLVKTLNKLGYENILTAQDGRQGVETYQTHIDGPQPIEMIFMDVQMPILDGYGASLAIRTIQGEDRDGPHIVAITANDFVEDRKACLRSGMCRFAGKPLDWGQLMVLLKEGHESVHGRQSCRCRAQKRLQW